MSTVRKIFETMEYGPAPETPEVALEWLKKHEYSFRPFIDGRFRDAPDAPTFESINPRNGQPIAKLTQCGQAEVDAAVAAAAAAFPAWSGLTGHLRARYLYAIARQIQKHSRLFAVLETLDNGKPIRESRDIDIPLVARHFYHHAGWAQLLAEEFPGYEATGVCGQIIPWNFPLLMLAWKIAPALAAGNTVVLKPAEFTSLTALLFAEVLQQIRLPAGVVNIITGNGSTGELLVKHPEIQKLAFTGSTEVGRIIRKATAGTGKKLSLELGGKSPFIVFEDADLDSVVEGVVDAIWFNQGQVCCAGSRLLVQEGIAERLEQKLRARMETLRVGDPLDKAVDIGAIVAPVQLQRIEKLVEQGKSEGATCWQPSWAVPQEGYFYPPTLFTNVEPASQIAQIEIFGPVLVSMTFRTPSEAIELANNTVYGLAASVWTENVNLALDVAPKLKAGVVWVNSTNMFDAASGFGGYRESGFGREGGKEGMYEYLVPNWERKAALSDKANSENTGNAPSEVELSRMPLAESDEDSFEPGIDRSPKLYIGGKQIRPDSGYSFAVRDASGNYCGEVGLGNRKDIRNAVEAAHKAASWSRSTAHLRAQILYYLAENLFARAREFENRLAVSPGHSREQAKRERQHRHEGERAELQSGESLHEPGAEPQSGDIDRRDDQDGSDRDDFEPYAGNPQRVAHVARETRREGRRDARIHDEQTFPTVEKCDRRAIRFAQVDVPAARFRPTRRELAITERAAQRHHPHQQPDDQQPKGRAERASHAGGGEKDPDPNDLADDERGDRDEAELAA